MRLRLLIMVIATANLFKEPIMAVFTDNGIPQKCGDCDGKGCEACDGFGIVSNPLKWRVEFTIGSYNRADSELEWNAFDEKALSRLNDPGDIELIIGLLWICIEKQAEIRGVSEDDFAERLGGDAILEAYKALKASLSAFFTARGAAPLAIAMERTQIAIERAMKRAEKKIADLDLTDAEVDALMDKAMSEATVEKERILQTGASGK